MVTIRNMKIEDRIAVEQICIATASAKAKATAESVQSTLLLYADFYVKNCRDHCFVAVNQNGQVVGYILCAPDYTFYRKEFTKSELASLLAKGLNYFFMGIGEMVAQIPFRKKYPAHLHIDILDEYQRQGIGHKLMDALINHLKSQEIGGVVLFVDPNNEKGINFYKKYGFSSLSRHAMGLRI